MGSNTPRAPDKMKPFKLSPKHDIQIRKRERRQSSLVHGIVSEMESVMLSAIESIVQAMGGSDTMEEPTLNGMFQVSKTFYKKVHESAFDACEQEKRSQFDRKRLAKAPPKMPKDFQKFDKIFQERKYWKRVIKRSDLLTERLRKAYLQKLRRSFAEVLPQIRSGEMTPNDAKKYMRTAWDSSKSRVETIFRTETTNYFGTAQVNFFESDPEIIGFLFDSLRDSETTGICRSRHGLVYRPGSKELRENTPALHWNCRSHLIALANTPANLKMLNDPSRDPRNRVVVPLPPKWRIAA